MARVRLIHWNGPEGRERKLRLASLGHDVIYDDLDGAALMRRLRSDSPDAFLIDLSRLPSHGREIAMALRSSKGTRAVPIVFVDGEPAKVAQLKALLPDATYTTWGRLNTALPRAIARPPASPIVPPSSLYTGKPAVTKLGVKDGMRVCLVAAPPGFSETLTPLPPKVKFSAKPESTADLFLCFVRSAREIAAVFANVAAVADRQTVWMIWRKKASGVTSDLNGNVIRETGLALGWVDFKVCAIDETWSGLAFKRRR
jgi:hypothetical protein